VPIAVSGRVIFNIISSPSILAVSSINGNVVAPTSNFNQARGTVYGQIIAGNFANVIQINRPSCGSTTGSNSGTVPPGTQTSNSGSVPPDSQTSNSGSVPPGSQTSNSNGVPPDSQTSNSAYVPPDSQTSNSNGVPPDSQTSNSGYVPPNSQTSNSGGVPPDSQTSNSAYVPPSSQTGNSGDVPMELVPNQDCPFFDFLDTCPGLSFNLNGADLSFANFHVISFGGFVADTGDVEGRLAVKGAVNLGPGYSIGDKVVSIGSYPSERYSAYSFIAGSVSWTSGGLYPDGAASTEERAFVAGNLSTAAYLQSRFDGPCAGEGCLDAAFSGAFGCYSNLQSAFSSATVNVDTQLVYSGIQLTCNSSTSTQYIATVSGDQLNTATNFQLVNCGSNAIWIINIAGSGDFSFHGDSFPVDAASNVVYNVLGSGRTITVLNAVNGAIIAPSNIIHQTGGVIRGKVVVADITHAVQINKPICLEENGDSRDNAAFAFGPSILTVILFIMAIF